MVAPVRSMGSEGGSAKETLRLQLAFSGILSLLDIIRSAADTVARDSEVYTFGVFTGELLMVRDLSMGDEGAATPESSSYPASPAQTVPGSPLLYGIHTVMEPPPKPEDIPEVAGFTTQPKLVPTMIAWNHGGSEVAIEGSFDNWTTRHPLQRTGRNFTVVKLLPPGVYQYKFIVDGEWKYDPNQAAMHDDAGNVNNVIEVREFVPENLGGLAGFDPPPSPRERSLISLLAVIVMWSLAVTTVKK